ncbi:MAG: response regulator transcription factor [Ignavibacteriales bacterium]|nr:response regulator transcription factor [Ignavibacteriales bacterium]
MKMFIADGSPLGSARLMTLLSDVDNLEIVGYTQDAFVALETIRKVRPDVVVLDIELRGGSGVNLLCQLKVEFPSTKIFVVSNASSEQYRKKCLECGADFFFDKSTEIHEVPQAIRQLVSLGPQPSTSLA